MNEIGYSRHHEETYKGLQASSKGVRKNTLERVGDKKITRIYSKSQVANDNYDMEVYCAKKD